KRIASNLEVVKKHRHDAKAVRHFDRRVHFLRKMLTFWTFPQFSTKPVDKIVDFLILDKLF
ncbi:hypothetical protein, partial [Acinetobacter baumannii]|uniref:hypothetical protein n=1 Tax=Acinetobacter baumannii TaxID=470 RepID=UPI001BC8857A